MKFAKKLKSTFLIFFILSIACNISIANPIQVKPTKVKPTNSNIQKRKKLKFKKRIKKIKIIKHVLKLKRIIKDNENKKNHQKSINSLIFSLLGIIPFIGIIFSIIGIITGFNALTKINTNNDKYKGKFLSILAIALGLLGIFGHLVILSTLISL